ncbi:hypothetical protein [Paenibacillus flagellatus]|uniref:Uncharacterized protein n=1 Tax=Paenibacillus flagellatus TaxID=2211139 RepID=A0A2V5KB23_9BACL|nr:hypothetical protein [Paenibacillus flagellatus]PYI51040.1 hypothetical protein DLM86_27120 [Paenibacillus flagellatus]
MTDGHNDEKLKLERAAVRDFIRLYNARHDVKLRLLYQHDRPDAVLQTSRGGKLGVEITHLFYDAAEAKALLGRPDGTVSGPVTLAHLIAQLNELVRRKESKRQAYDPAYPISLLIRNSSPTFRLTEIWAAREHIHKPNDVFVDTWFLTRDGTPDWKLVNLDDI